MNRRRGFALLLVLWTLVPVATLLLTLASTARSDSQLTSNLLAAARLQQAADAGIETTIFALLHPGTPPSDLQIRIANASVRVRAKSLAGLVNPNSAPVELLRALLVHAGAPARQADAIAAAILDWRTPDQPGRPNTAKFAAYRAAGRSDGPPGAPFQTIAELRDVLGMTPALFAAIRPVLTLYTDRPPDPALAPPLVRAALGDLGSTPSQSSGVGDVFQIDALAQAGDGHQAHRRAIVKLDHGGAGRGWRIFEWSTPASPE